jgi:hypothetical protein
MLMEKKEPGVSKGLRVKMERWGNTCPTLFDRDENGDSVRQYLQGTLLWASNGQLLSTFLWCCAYGRKDRKGLKLGV